MFVFIFYFFYFSVLVSAVMVVTSNNPVHSVLFLVMVFFWGSCLIFMLKLDFMALVFIMIYAGAIAVLFLFVIMMLNVKLYELSSIFMTYLPVGFFLMFGFTMEVFIYFYAYYKYVGVKDGVMTLAEGAVDWSFLLGYVGNIKVLGAVLYTYYSFLVIINAYILLVAMVASVFLTTKCK